jgi:hypothetical protein
MNKVNRKQFCTFFCTWNRKTWYNSWLKTGSELLMLRCIPKSRNHGKMIRYGGVGVRGPFFL